MNTKIGRRKLVGPLAVEAGSLRKTALEMKPPAPVETHFHVVSRNFFSGTETDRGVFDEEASALMAATAMLSQDLTLRPVRHGGGTVVLEVDLPVSFRVRPCQKFQCVVADIHRRLEEDR